MNKFQDDYEDYVSPTNAGIIHDEKITKTPFSKGNLNSKSPKLSLLKKSKRRECTPDSPQHSASKLPNIIQGKHETKNENGFKPIQLFAEPTKIPLKKKLDLALIEEHVEEVSDKYYDFLGKQTTPESLFVSLFSNDKECTKEDPNTKENETISEKVKSILSLLNNHDFTVIEACKLVLISHEFNYAEIDIEGLKVSFKSVDLLQSHMLGLHIEDNGWVIVKAMISFKTGEQCPARMIFISKEEDMQLSIIELSV